MQKIYNLDQFYELDKGKYGGLGEKVIKKLQMLIPNSSVAIKWFLPMVVYSYNKPGSQKTFSKNICYLTYKNNQLLLGFNNGHKFTDFHSQFQRTDHSFIKFFLVNSIEDLLTSEFELLIQEALEIARYT